jgi:hypothetical protein
MKTGQAGAEVAMNWLFEHMEDAGKTIFGQTVFAIPLFRLLDSLS